MSSTYLIDGVGDEVTVLLGIFLAVFIVIVSWMSTRVSDTGAAVPFEINDPAQINEIIRVRPSQHVATQSQNARPTGTNSNTESTSATSPSNNESEATASNSTTSTVAPDDLQRMSETSASSQTSQTVENVLRQRGAAASSTSEQDQPSTSTSTSSDLITIRLKFMNDTQKTVQASPDETLEQFRRQHFPPETANRYRLIYGGQVLRDGSRTLRDLNLSTVGSDGQPAVPVVHCFLSADTTPDNVNRPANATQQLEMTAEELHIGSLFLPIIGVALLGLWYLCIFHTSLFSIQSLVSILGLTFLYVVLLVNQLL